MNPTVYLESSAWVKRYVAEPGSAVLHALLEYAQARSGQLIGSAWLGFLTDGAEAGELDWRAIGGTWGVATSRLKLWQPQLPVPASVADIASRIRAAHPTNGVLMANYVVKYFEDMHLHIQRLTELLASGTTIHYIVGNSSFYGVLVPVEQILAELFAEQGFSSVEVVPLRKRNCKKELREFEIIGHSKHVFREVYSICAKRTGVALFRGVA